jgi:hypothetical protein
MLAMLALVLLFRTLVPAGYMIAPSAGWPILTPCEAPAPSASADHDGHHTPAEPKQPCAYAALASPVLPPAPAEIGAPPTVPGPAPAGRADRDPFLPGPASFPPPSTGPPHRV